MRVEPPDLELWLATYVRAMAAVEGVDVAVSNKEPATLTLPLAKPIIVIRDDSGPRLSHVTFDRSVGISVLAGSKKLDQPANDLARWVAGVMFDIDLPLVAASLTIDGGDAGTTDPSELDGGTSTGGGDSVFGGTATTRLIPACPIAAVIPDGCNGPYAVTEELDVARRYMTAQYVVTGSW